MKHLKYFESNDLNTIEVGDYVLLKCIKNNNIRDKIKEFATKNIGKIIEISRHGTINNRIITVYYENIPKNLKSVFTNNSFQYNIYYGLYHSKNKEDLEILVDQENYNL